MKDFNLKFYLKKMIEMKCLECKKQNEIINICINPQCLLKNKLFCNYCTLAFHKNHANQILIINDILE